MFLKSVLIRFYKSFNYDYLRKLDSKVKTRHSWEMFNGMWYPYVTIPIVNRSGFSGDSFS